MNIFIIKKIIIPNSKKKKNSKQLINQSIYKFFFPKQKQNKSLNLTFLIQSPKNP